MKSNDVGFIIVKFISEVSEIKAFVNYNIKYLNNYKVWYIGYDEEHKDINQYNSILKSFKIMIVEQIYHVMQD